MRVDVLLIHPPVNFHLLKRPAVGLGSVVGYGLLHIAACLTQRGYKVAVWNLDNALSMGTSLRDIERGLKAYDPKIVGIELNWLTFSRGAIQTAELSKRVRPDVPVVIGGTHATLFSREIVQTYRHIVDAMLKGEAEKTFPRVVENLEERGCLGEVGGLVFHEGQHLREIPLKRGDIYANIDDVPPYSYKLVNQVIMNHAAVATPFGTAINTTRGPCEFGCVHCIGPHIGLLSGRTSFSVHSPEWIVNQINLLVDEGVRVFSLYDLFYLIETKRLVEVAKAIRKEKIDEKILGIDMVAVPGILDGYTLEELSRASVYGVDYGCESGSNRILSLLNRPTSREKILDSVKVTSSKGIIPWTFWMTGLPDERLEDIQDTLDLINKTIEFGALPKWITPLVVLPSTEIFERPEDFGIRPRFKSFEDFSTYSELEMKAVSWYPEAVSHETEHLSRYDILHATLDLKLEIFRRREEIFENFMEKFASRILSYHPRLSTRTLEQMVKYGLDIILKTFF